MIILLIRVLSCLCIGVHFVLYVPWLYCCIDMSTADWMKLSLFARKFREATASKRIDRVIINHNEAHTLIQQIQQHHKLGLGKLGLGKRKSSIVYWVYS